MLSNYYLETIQILKSIIFYGQEPPTLKSTTTVNVVNYQLLAVMLLGYLLGYLEWLRSS